MHHPESWSPTDASSLAGLLPLLKSIQRPTELKKYSGETFGVDGYGWLHRGAISCAIELAEGKPTCKSVHPAVPLPDPTVLTLHPDMCAMPCHEST